MALKNRLYQWSLLNRYIFSILPQVERELQGWKKMLKSKNPGLLHLQALNSIRTKRFHCQGGAVYALLNPAARHHLLPLIVSFQTISDYLDNLSDRIPWPHLSALPEEEKDFHMERGLRQLHLAMSFPLENNDRQQPDYYKYFPLKEDQGYLHALSNCSKKHLARLPAYKDVQEMVLFLTKLYCDLQALKHLSCKFRQKYLQEWFQPYKKKYPDLLWNEFAAATGSTLGTFALFAAASRRNINHQELEAIFHCYFPWICGLHILLDYFIDQAEDRQEGDLNFIFYFNSSEHFCRRLVFFLKNALQKIETLIDSAFHRTVVKGLLALYLSDPKIKRQGMQHFARKLITATGEKDTVYMYHICHLLRICGWF